MHVSALGAHVIVVDWLAAFESRVWMLCRCRYDAIGKRDWGNPGNMWAYLTDQVTLARFEWPVPHAVYAKPLAAFGDRPFWVLTSNADGMFGRSGYVSGCSVWMWRSWSSSLGQS